MNHAIIAALCFAALPHAAFAQEESVVVLKEHLAAADDARASADAWKRWADDFSYEMRTSMHTLFADRMGASKTVKGAPYSADILTESNQALADGNVISRKASGAIYRDGEGRVRQESPGDGREKSVFVRDPVAQRHFMLTPGAKRVIVLPDGDLLGARVRERIAGGVKNRQVVRVNGTEVKVEDGKVSIDGKPVEGATAEVKAGGKVVRVDNGRVTIDGKEIAAAPGPGHVVVKTTEARDSADGLKREEVRVQVIHAGDRTIGLREPPPPPGPPPAVGAAPPMPPMPPMPGVQTMRFESVGKLGKGVTTSLGSKEFEGVKAEGKSTTWTIAAGEIGNKNPISVTSETWYSPELQATVYSRYNDPRTGESIYRLANIRRGEPPAELFKFPDDAKGRKP